MTDPPILCFPFQSKGMMIHCAIVKQTRKKSVEEYLHVKDNKEGVLYIMTISLKESLYNLNFHFNNM